VKTATRKTKRVSRCQYADRLFAKAIKKRDGHCQNCGFVGPLDCCHFFGRRHFSIRWNPDNAMALCRPCHFAFDGNEYTKWKTILNRLGEERLRELEAERNVLWDKDYEAVFTRLKEWA
jgi:5-methylcytosine-specific restriction endonuclease McrA